MRKTTSLSAEYFEGLYRNNPDPWKFETSEYEREKYAATIRALGSERSATALEVGCANGVLTRLLAEQCDNLLAIEVSPTALHQAQARCSDLDHVTFLLAGVPDGPIPGVFDLIVLSEVAYYWDAADSERAAAMFMAQRRLGGRIVLVHWLGETDYPVSGDEAVERLQRSLASTIRVDLANRTQQYRLDLWRWMD